jgi:hypothetical protein
MNVGRLTRQVGLSVLGAMLCVGVNPSRVLAQNGHSHGAGSPQDFAADDRSRANALVQVVRDATERFKNVAVAEAAGYQLQFGCVTGSDGGAMGMHFVNGPLVMDGELDATRPEIVIYEPLPNGKLRLIGADYLILADAWNTKHPEGPPQLMGQLLHLFEAPNRFGLPPFYTLHVWAWKESPTGTFVNWHANVSCDAWSGGR